MTRENLKLGQDLLSQIDHLEVIKNKIQVHYNQSKDKSLKELLSECNDVCSALKDIKQKRFEDL